MLFFFKWMDTLKYWGSFHQSTEKKRKKKKNEHCWRRIRWRSAVARTRVRFNTRCVPFHWSCCGVVRGNFHLQKMRSKLIRSISHIEQHKNPAVDAMSCTNVQNGHQHTMTHKHQLTPYCFSPRQRLHLSDYTQDNLASWSDKFSQTFFQNNGSSTLDSPMYHSTNLPCPWQPSVIAQQVTN